MATKDEGQLSPICEELSEITGFYPIFKVSSKLNKGIDTLRNEMVKHVKLAAKTGITGYIQRRSSFKRLSVEKKNNIINGIFQSSESEIMSKINTQLEQTAISGYREKLKAKSFDGVTRQISNFSTSSKHFIPRNHSVPLMSPSTEKQLRRKQLVKQKACYDSGMTIPAIESPEEEVGHLEAAKEMVLKYVSRWRSSIRGRL